MFISSLALLISSLYVTTNGNIIHVGEHDTEFATNFISCENVGNQYAEIHLTYMPLRNSTSFVDYAGGLCVEFKDSNMDRSITLLQTFTDNSNVPSSIDYEYGYYMYTDVYCNVSCSFYLKYTGYSTDRYYYSNNYELYYPNQNGFTTDTIVSNTTWYNLLGGDNVSYIIDLYLQVRLLDSYTWSMFENNMGNDYQSGFNDGYSQGYQNGKNDGYQNGYLDGKTEWYDKGVQFGHDTGYQEGLEDGTNNNYGFPSLFYSIADTPVLMIQRLFNFDLFGMNVLTVVLSLFTAILLIHIAKKIIK